MAGYITLDEGAYLQPRLSYTNEHSPYLSYPTTDQQRHENISTVNEASLERVLASGGIQRVKCQRVFKAITQRATSKLQRPITLKTTGSHSITLSTKDKLAIIFSYKNNYVVCRKRDYTVTVVTDPIFKTKNPTIIYDGYQKGDILNNVKMILMFAVAKTAHESAEIHFKSRDLILVLAKSREVYLGISPSSEVGFFPREKVVFITKPRICIYPGLIIKVQAITDMIFGHQTIRRGKIYSVCKGNDDPFDWRLPSSHLRIHLENFREHDGEMNNEHVYQRTIPVYAEIPALPLKDENVYFDRKGEVAFQNAQETNNTPVGKCAERLESIDILSDEEGDRPYFHQKQDTTMPTYPHPPPLSSDPPPPLPPRNLKLYENFGGICEGDEAEEDRNFSDEESAKGEEIHIVHSRNEKTKNSFDDSNEDSTDHYEPVDGSSNWYDEKSDNEEGLHYDSGRSGKMTKECPTTSGNEDEIYTPNDWEGYSQRDIHGNVDAPFEGLDDDHLEKQEEDRNHTTENSFDNSNEDSTEYYEPIDGRSTFSFNKSANEEGLYYDSDGSKKMTKKPTEDHPPVPAPRRQSLEQKRKNETENLLEKLLPYHEVIINEELRHIVSESVEDNDLHDLCKTMKVSKNRLRDINDQKETIYEKTYDLLGMWQRKFGSNANVGFLIEALVEVNPDQLNLILGDMLRYFEDGNVRDSGMYHKIPDEDNLYALPKKAKDNKVKVFLNDLRCFHEVEFNKEMRHIVSLYVDEDVWHDLGQSLEIPKNIRREIEKNRDDIFGKTFDLLGQWHQKFGSEATLGFLLEALVSVNPEDLYLILKDLLKDLDTSDYEDVK